MPSKGVAVVTGAARGIGRAIALRLADDGYDVAINDIGSGKEGLDILAAELLKKGRKTLVTIGDVSVEADVKSLVESVVKELGSLDVMVANAGVCMIKSLFETTVADWDHIYAINVRGTFLCYKYAGQQMVRQGRGGRMIGASSVVGKQAEAMACVYSSTKFAIRGLTQTAAKELGPQGITVNAYAPGAIDTPMMKTLAESTGDVNAFYEMEKNRTAVGYNGDPSDIANVVSFLVSKEAHFITGQTISVNGGRYFD